MSTNTKKKHGTGAAVVLIVLCLLALGTLGYIIWRQFNPVVPETAAGYVAAAGTTAPVYDENGTQLGSLVRGAEVQYVVEDAEGGAVVVQEVKTGEILACASYPTYDLSTYNRDFKELSEDPYKPLYDRALLAEYAPGSIYKMVTAIAAIDMGHIGEYYEITDEGVYMYYAKENFTPKCYVWTSSNATARD